MFSPLNSRSNNVLACAAPPVQSCPHGCIPSSKLMTIHHTLPTQTECCGMRQRGAARLCLRLALKHAGKRSLEEQVRGLQVRRETQHVLRGRRKGQAAHVD